MSSWPQPFLTAYVVAVGAVVGSFLNVVIYRVPLRRSIVSPGSACPACAAPIRWFDNIPVLSWLLLRARCRACAAPISARYPLVEAAAALMAYLAISRYGVSVVGLEVLVFGWISLALGLIDYDHQILPDVITYPAIVFGLGCSGASLLAAALELNSPAFLGFTSALDSLLGAAAGALLPITVIVVYRLIRGEEGMGWGDVKYLAAIGAVVGLRDCLWVLVLASVVGAVVGLVLIALGRGSGKTALPFGTFLAMAVLIWLYAPPSWFTLLW
jgi:leader peptidase (prepilin peptidase)/N-methyltransferase